MTFYVHRPYSVTNINKAKITSCNLLILVWVAHTFCQKRYEINQFVSNSFFSTFCCTYMYLYSEGREKNKIVEKKAFVFLLLSFSSSSFGIPSLGHSFSFSWHWNVCVLSPLNQNSIFTSLSQMMELLSLLRWILPCIELRTSACQDLCRFCRSPEGSS